jgi:uncharacterized membrane protein YeaQ/YmgE (transglycosylase-associated protein family)
MPETQQIVTWIVIGGLAGAAAGSLIRRKLYFYEILLAGLLGAVVGGLVIEILGVDLPDYEVTISTADLATAFIGAVIVIGYAEIVASVRRRDDR